MIQPLCKALGRGILDFAIKRYGSGEGVSCDTVT